MKDGKKNALFEPIARTIRSIAWTAGTLCLISVTQSAVAMPLTVPQIQTATTNTLRYECRGGSALTVQYMNTKNKQSFALLTVDGRKMLFVNVLAASGAKYVGDHYTWWTKGPEGSLTDDTADPKAPPMLAECKTGS
ncbi:MliC family protein [Burkholderia sp. S171]|uniref:MliC family protein n=1 Tax=Burkholderia sp. S171 TaxID=1641860 RepID=UPI00131B4A21|nr:MliC family protein [Burkholderia sp. S171]